MGWDNSFQTIIVLPTGATSGQRIVIDGTTGLISIYNSAGTLVDQLGGPNGAAVFGPQPGPSFDFNVPAAGLLTTYDASGTLTAEWDPGNQVLTLLDNINLSFTRITGFEVRFGQIAAAGTLPTATEISAAAVVNGSSVGGILGISSGLITGSLNDAAEITVNAGVSGSASGSHNNPFISIGDSALNTRVDAYITGNLIGADPTFNPWGWQTPAYATSWSGSTTFNGSVNWGHLEFQLLPIDAVQIVGAFTASGAAPGNIVFTLPAASGVLPNYRPTQQVPIWVQRNNGGTLSGGYAAVSTAGNFILSAQTGLGEATGNEYLVNGIIPLHSF